MTKKTWIILLVGVQLMASTLTAQYLSDLNYSFIPNRNAPEHRQAVNRAFSSPAYVVDTVPYVLEKKGLLGNYHLYRGDERIIFNDFFSEDYRPELKSHFAPYPLANKELIKSEIYHKRNWDWARTSALVASVNVIFKFATINKSSYDRWNLALDIATIATGFTGVYFATKDLKQQKKAVAALNRRQ
ncbi:MAG: hypothetical protein RIR11_1420 [Bacteroidota bacterium]|jgi:hypothetical protein